MIGYLSGTFLSSEDTGAILLATNGVGYSVLVSPRIVSRLLPGSQIDLFIHTNVRETAIELFGFSTAWEKKVFLLLTSVSGVGPRTALAILNALDAEMILSSIIREDRATLTSISGIGKKTVEHLITDLGEKARRLLADRPRRASAQAPELNQGLKELAIDPEDEKKSSKKKKNQNAHQAASPSEARSNMDIADLWNDAVAALSSLGYKEADAISAIKIASAKITESRDSDDDDCKSSDVPSLEALIRTSLQLMSRNV